MRTPKILELLNEGRIEELKKALEDELYQASMKGKPRRKTTLCSHEEIFQVYQSYT